MTPKENFINICNLTTSVLNLRKGSLSYKTRKHPIHLARLVAGVIGRKEGNIHHKIIGDILKRDRSVVYHYEKTHSSNYGSCEKYRAMYNKVYMAYKDIKNSKKTFVDRYFMKEYLRKKGIKDSDNFQVTLRIRSGKETVDIKSSYFDFSNKLEMCKIVLLNYNYEIKIINNEKQT
jgi:hypothetical protein